MKELVVHVFATTTAGTGAALSTAAILSRDLHAGIVLLVPHTVPYAEPLECPSRRPAHSVARFRALVNDCGSRVRVWIAVCRPEFEHIEALLPRGATLLIGGHVRHIWPTREQRLAHALVTRGHHVLFVSNEVRHAA